MTQQFTLPDRQAEQLMTVLEKNEGAIRPADAVRWAPEDAEKIGLMREDLEQQME